MKSEFTFEVIVKDKAVKGLQSLLKSEPASYGKATLLIRELAEHPRTGTGHPKQLSGNKAGLWSRRISQKHRLVYEIQDEIVTVLVLSAYGHYDDK